MATVTSRFPRVLARQSWMALVAGAGLAMLVGGFVQSPLAAQGGGSALTVTSVSARADMVSGGDVLVRITGSAPLRNVKVTVDGRDVTAVFKPDGSSAFVGLVEGLAGGANTITATAGRATATLAVTNYPITGPIFSGPHSSPFVCETEPSGLGPAIDDKCSVATRVTYFYKSTASAAAAGGENPGASAFKPLADPAGRPADLAMLTLKDGRTVPYVVRVESGTINRAIYRIAMLDDRSAWNQKLQYRFGGGCGFGRHQGRNRETEVLDDIPLSRGYAVATSTLNVYGTACDDVVSAETAMMVKEHFIERYGVPRYVVGWGGSGGAMQQNLIADNYPGILDAIMPASTFPDGLTLVHTPTDCALLNHYFFDRQTTMAWTDAQRLAVSGFGVRASCLDPSGDWGAFVRGGTNSVYPRNCNFVIPAEKMYDAVANPKGVRCTIYESLITYLGKDSATGFARRPLGNVGIQYGLRALNDGTISAEQFLDLNRRIGGFDIDGNFIAQRTVSDPEGAAAAYRSGRVFTGAGMSLPILDLRNYRDHDGDVHTRFHTFETRQRLIDANGTAANQILWTWGLDAPSAVYNAMALDAMDQWLENLRRDTSTAPYAEKVLKAKPSTLVDGCWDPSTGARIDEPATMNPDARCNRLFPIYGNARLAAGAPIQENIEKCTLRPANPGDYRGLTAEQQSQLREIFAEGVCDYSKPGVGQQPSGGEWQSFGPAPQQRRTTETAGGSTPAATTSSR